MKDLKDTIFSILTRIQESADCQSEIQKLQGEVLQFKVTGVEEYCLAFRKGTVELDNEATPTFRFEGTTDVLSAIFSGQLSPLAAILTRRVKATLDPVRGPLIARIFSVALRQTTKEKA
jgi:putative sterol carrier protein